MEIILYEPEIHIGADIAVSDIAGWRLTTMATIPNSAFFTTAPDWVAEVLSPSTARLDRHKKLPLYANWNVHCVWVVDPIARTLEAFRLEKERWVLLDVFSLETEARIEPFDAIAFDVASLWSRVEL